MLEHVFPAHFGPSVFLFLAELEQELKTSKAHLIMYGPMGRPIGLLGILSLGTGISLFSANPLSKCDEGEWKRAICMSSPSPLKSEGRFTLAKFLTFKGKGEKKKKLGK